MATTVELHLCKIVQTNVCFLLINSYLVLVALVVEAIEAGMP